MRIVIIGGGVAGLSIGWKLLKSGTDVLVLERAQPARGASWASAGMLAIAGELGNERGPEAKFAHHARALWADFASDLEQDSGIRIGFRENGALIAAMEAGQEASLPSGPRVRRLSVAEALAVEPMLSPAISAAVFAEGEAVVDSRALGEALTRGYLRAGGKLARNEAVIRIEVEDGTAVAARTTFGGYEGDVFVLAAGAWSGLVEGLPAAAVPPVKPVKGEMIALAPAAGDILPRRVVWGNGVYLVPRNGYLLVGATMEEAGFDTRPTSAAANYLREHAIGLMPTLAQWELADHWAGLRPGSPDGLPILGPTSVRRLYAATGQFRNGILFAPAVAELLCRFVLEQQPVTLAFDPRRFV